MSFFFCQIRHSTMKRALILLAAVSILGYSAKSALAQTSSISVLYVPLIGITSVPEPLSLPNGPGNVTYGYAVKNFLKEVSLTNIRVTDDHCSPVQFTTGDDNGNSELDHSETWRYSCTTRISTTTESISTAVGIANNITAIHNAHATVIVGSDNPAPLVSIVNITKVAYPLSLPAAGGFITFTYKVSNPGVVPLNRVTVSDDKCGAMSGKIGDTNGNNFLDTTEVWIYTCTTDLRRTTTNTAIVTAFANGLKAVDAASLTVTVASSSIPGFPDQSIPSFPETGVNADLKLTTWGAMLAMLAVFTLVIVLKKRL